MYFEIPSFKSATSVNSCKNEFVQLPKTSTNISKLLSNVKIPNEYETRHYIRSINRFEYQGIHYFENRLFMYGYLKVCFQWFLILWVQTKLLFNPFKWFVCNCYCSWHRGLKGFHSCFIINICNSLKNFMCLGTN